MHTCTPYPGVRHDTTPRYSALGTLGLQTNTQSTDAVSIRSQYWTRNVKLQIRNPQTQKPQNPET